MAERDDDLPTPPVRDRFALIVGLTFLAAAGLLAVTDLDSVGGHVSVLWPLVALAFGVGIIAEARRR